MVAPGEGFHVNVMELPGWEDASAGEIKVGAAGILGAAVVKARILEGELHPAALPAEARQ